MSVHTSANSHSCIDSDDRQTSRWQNADWPAADTGVPIDHDYIAAHEYDRTVSVGYDRYGEEPRTENGQPLATEGGDGSESELDAIRDENAKTYTVAGEATSVAGTTFFVDEKGADWDKEKYRRLWLLNSGKDSHKRGSGANIHPQHKEDKDGRWNYEEAESLISGVGLTPQQKHRVLTAVRSTDFRRYTYLCSVDGYDRYGDERVGAVEIVSVGIVACVVAYWTDDDPLEHPAVEAIAEKVEVENVQYVAKFVAERKEFGWLSDETFEA